MACWKARAPYLGTLPPTPRQAPSSAAQPWTEHSEETTGWVGSPASFPKHPPTVHPAFSEFEDSRSPCNRAHSAVRRQVSGLQGKIRRFHIPALCLGAAVDRLPQC